MPSIIHYKYKYMKLACSEFFLAILIFILFASYLCMLHMFSSGQIEFHSLHVPYRLLGIDFTFRGPGADHSPGRRTRSGSGRRPLYTAELWSRSLTPSQSEARLSQAELRLASTTAARGHSWRGEARPQFNMDKKFLFAVSLPFFCNWVGEGVEWVGAGKW